MYSTPLSCVSKNGQNGQFYVMGILAQLKKEESGERGPDVCSLTPPTVKVNRQGPPTGSLPAVEG